MQIATVGTWTIYRYDTVDSTQRVAADLVAAGASDRTAVVANRQTAGYGRKGDAWQDLPDSSLLVTLILKPSAPSQMAHLAMVAALAVVDAIAEVGAVQACIKWPNDIIINERKVGGILGDAVWRGDHLDAIRLGIGLNIGGSRDAFAAQALPDATSIIAETGHEVQRDALLTALLRHVTTWQDWLLRGEIDQTVDLWRQSLGTIGRHVVVALHDHRMIHGVAHDVTRNGDLIVIADNGTRCEVTSAETRSLRHRDRISRQTQ